MITKLVKELTLADFFVALQFKDENTVVLTFIVDGVDFDATKGEWLFYKVLLKDGNIPLEDTRVRFSVDFTHAYFEKTGKTLELKRPEYVTIGSCNEKMVKDRLTCVSLVYKE